MAYFTGFLEDYFFRGHYVSWLPWWLRCNASACNVGNLGLIPGSGRSLGEGNGYPLQYSCLKNSMDRGAWQATVHGGHKELDTTERLSLSISGLELMLDDFLGGLEKREGFRMSAWKFRFYFLARGSY